MCVTVLFVINIFGEGEGAAQVFFSVFLSPSFSYTFLAFSNLFPSSLIFYTQAATSEESTEFFVNTVKAWQPKAWRKLREQARTRATFQTAQELRFPSLEILKWQCYRYCIWKSGVVTKLESTRRIAACCYSSIAFKGVACILECGVQGGPLWDYETEDVINLGWDVIGEATAK